MRGYSASRFSFNSAQGRCPECEGAGQIKLEMNFLPPAFVRCETCNGTRFNRETLDIEYGGKNIAQGDVIYIFDSEHDGGAGLVARGVVTSAGAVPRKRGVERQTPRVNVTVRRTARAKKGFGRTQLESFTDWKDGQPQAELNFKFYRQATNKIGGITNDAAAYLDQFF